MAALVNKRIFCSHLNRVHSFWQENKESLFDDADILCFPLGSTNTGGETPVEDAVYKKSSSVHLFLMGWEFSDSLLVLTSSTLFVLSSEKKCSLLAGISEASGDEENIPPLCVEMRLLRKNKKDGNQENFALLLSEMRSSSSHSLKLGWFKRETFYGRLVNDFMSTCESSGAVELVDISRALSSLLLVKDEDEVDSLKKASALSNKV